MKRGTVLGMVVGVVVLGAMVAPVGGASQGTLLQTGDVDPDSVNIGVDLREDGSAEWTIEYRVQLTDENETAAYEDLVADVENNSSAYLDRFGTRINATVADAETETGREMRATDFEVAASIEELPQTYGTLTYSFVWHGFATVEGEEIHAGDAIEGFFLDSSTSMFISWPEGYSLSSVEPTPSSEFASRIVWDGPLEFVDGEPRIVLEPASTTTTSSTTTPSQEMNGSNDAIMLIALVIGAVIVLAFIAVWFHNRRTDEGGSPAASDERPPAGGGPPAAPAAPAEEPEETPEELLSNEERVSRFLAQHGGRAKQQEIVDGLGWTEAKTSQVLSSMADEGTIEKFRIGRENVVKLPEDDETEER